ncbi:MAG: ribose-5-phosphate isomerase RpiA [Actinomycetia bacterium]|nr:ribose-5-phosphate isomerase RpiA [Actinomycetes bacterium]
MHDAAKRAAARAALAFVRPDRLLGVGTGSTVAHFVDELGTSDVRPSRAVSTSCETDSLLRAIGVAVVPLQSAHGPIDLYVDGADEIDALGRAIKGGGGAHTREKRVAHAALTWVCIVDESKLVPHLGLRAAVPLEVERPGLPAVISVLHAWGASPRVREGWTADPLHALLDVSGLNLSDPAAVESQLESVPGVVACGVFAHRRADVILVGHPDGRTTTLRPT